ncbi:MAG TPA: glycosyltransferase family 87 protein [Gaiellaceae bacterium]
MKLGSLANAARQILGLLTIAAGPAFLMIVFVHDARAGSLAFDFHIGLVTASRFVHGHPLYGHGSPVYYVYPPFYAESLTPFLLVPVSVARWIAALASAGFVVAGLFRLGVRDLRAIGVALLWPPVVHGCEVANASFVVFLLIAFAWRGGWVAMGLAAALKLVAWPLLLWQAAARGLRPAIASAFLAVGLILGSWAFVGFEGLGAYPRFLQSVGASQGALGYSVSAAFSGGRIVAIVVALAALWRGWARVRARDEVGGIAYAVVAMLAAAPYVYDNYFTAALIPLALRRPRLSAAWLFPLAFWLDGSGVTPTLEAKMLAWTVFGALLVWLGEGAPRQILWSRGTQTSLDAA